MPKAGMLLQMDSSQHQWLQHIPEKWWLIAMIDDALFANMHVIRRLIEIKGLFHGGLHYSVNQEQDDTQIQRALEELRYYPYPC